MVIHVYMGCQLIYIQYCYQLMNSASMLIDNYKSAYKYCLSVTMSSSCTNIATDTQLENPQIKLSPVTARGYTRPCMSWLLA